MDKILKQIEEWNETLSNSTPEEIITFFTNWFTGKIILASSMGAEDQVLTDMISKLDKDLPIFTLDTGRLFPETYELLQKTEEHYNILIIVYFPDTAEVERMVNENGINLFYKSVENRKMCCDIRKKKPLKRALEGKEVWICGLRKDQSLERFSSKIVEWDETNELIKINPLLKWSKKKVWEYIKENNVPYNKLHEKGFPSIGCRPCTRAIQSGEDLRSGRWWWEKSTLKECGLHETSRTKGQ